MFDRQEYRQSQNPYASPAPQPSEFVADRTEDSQVTELRAFVGPNAEYYLKKWAPILHGPGGGAGMNWAAFFLSGFWFQYRKMYKLTLILYAFVLFESMVERVVFVDILGEAVAPDGLNRVVTLLLAAICGKYGNRWYLSHANKQIAQSRAGGLENEALWPALSKRGGTNLAASLGMFVLFLATVFAVFIFLDGPPAPLSTPVRVRQVSN